MQAYLASWQLCDMDLVACSCDTHASPAQAQVTWQVERPMPRQHHSSTQHTYTVLLWAEILCGQAAAYATGRQQGALP